MSKETGKEEYAVCNQCRAKKIRCGRERPSCANCTRLGLQCEWSGQGKKFNQTALLSHMVLGLSSRLQELETTVLDTQMSVNRLLKEPSIVLPSFARRQASHAPSTLGSSAQWSPDSVTKSIFTRPLGRFLTEHNNGCSERYYGPTSLESLLLDIKDRITESSDFETQMLRECALQARHKIDLLVGQGEEELIKDRSPPTAPPFAILDAMIEPYFSSISHHFPIWTKERFNRMTTNLRQSPSEQDLASIVCCNNLILMALSANLLCSHQGKSIQSRQVRKTSSIDFDVIAGFLKNAKRALKNIDQIVSPRLINVQALLSLGENAKFIVAQEHLSIGLSETLFALAARCAKSIGIHQWHSLRGQLSDEDVKERRNISYCLYALDKAICWTAGSSPSVPMADVHIDPTLLSSDDSTTAYLVATAELAKIEETIYLEVYASQAKARTEEQVCRFAAGILSRLQGWLSDSGIELDEVQQAPESPATKVELAIRFLCVQLLLIWPYKSHPDVIFQRSQEIAKMCMRLLIRLWHSPPDQGNHAVFPLFLASLAPLYLYEISTHILSDQGHNSDMLQDFIKILQLATDGRGEKSYNSRLYQMSLILMDVIAAQRMRNKRRKTESNLEPPTVQSDHTSQDQSVSDMLSPPASSCSYMGSEVREGKDDHGFESATFQDSEELFAFLSPIGSRNCELTGISDEYAQNIGSYAQGQSENLSSLFYGSELLNDLGGE